MNARNEFYDPGGQHDARVQQVFTRIARRYDLINDLQSFGLHRYWKRKLISIARPLAGDKALDICCGTGDLTLMLACCCAQVVGLDFNEHMLRIARERKLSWQHSSASRAITPTLPCANSLDFVQGDALKLPFPDHSFDIVTIAYGLRNLSDTKAGLSEMRRVARPGARLLVLDFGKPDNPIWRSLYFTYLKFFVPSLGWLFCGSRSAYAYILESLKHYPAQRGVAAQMQALGLVNVRIINLLGGIMSINYCETEVTMVR